MQTHTEKDSQGIAWIAAILLIAFCGAGVAAMMGWIPIRLGNPAQAVSTTFERPVAPAPAAAAVRCSECGVVRSVRRVAAKRKGPVGGPQAGDQPARQADSDRTYEVTIHLDDGSNRVITEVNAHAWRFGDKVRIVDGIIHSNAPSPA